MSKNVVSLHSVDEVGNVWAALKTGHHAFPILNHHQYCTGIIQSNYLLTILRHKGFYHHTKNGKDKVD